MGHGLELLNDPVAVRLLSSTNPARLAYNWTDGTPRVVPICFHWDGSAMHFGTQPHAPKITALRQNPTVALTIDTVRDLHAGMRRDVESWDQCRPVERSSHHVDRYGR